MLIVDDGEVCLIGVGLVEEDRPDIHEPDEMPEVMITPDRSAGVEGQNRQRRRSERL
jgi:hypothetical protein